MLYCTLLQGYVNMVLKGPSRPGEEMLQARDELNAEFKAMISQLESNDGAQVRSTLIMLMLRFIMIALFRVTLVSIHCLILLLS